MTTGKNIRRSASRLAIARWPDSNTRSCADYEKHGENDGSESDYSDAATSLRGEKRFRRSVGADRGRSARWIDHTVFRTAQASLYRRRQAAQLCECVSER